MSSAGNMLLREPLDDAGNRIFGGVSAACGRSVTCRGFRRLDAVSAWRREIASLARFASAAHSRPTAPDEGEEVQE
jgi:hypothetical protein